MPTVIVAANDAASATAAVATKSRPNQTRRGDPTNIPGAAPSGRPSTRPQPRATAAENASVPDANSTIPIRPTGNGSFPDQMVGANAATRWAVMFRSHDRLLTAFNEYSHAWSVQVSETSRRPASRVSTRDPESMLASAAHAAASAR